MNKIFKTATVSVEKKITIFSKIILFFAALIFLILFFIWYIYCFIFIYFLYFYCIHIFFILFFIFIFFRSIWLPAKLIKQLLLARCRETEGGGVSDEQGSHPVGSATDVKRDFLCPLVVKRGSAPNVSWGAKWRQTTTTTGFEGTNVQEVTL